MISIYLWIALTKKRKTGKNDKVRIIVGLQWNCPNRSLFEGKLIEKDEWEFVDWMGKLF